MTSLRTLPFILAIALAAVAPAGTLTTRDGQTYTGALQLRPGEVAVTTDAGVKAIPLKSVAVADFKAGGAAAAKPGHGLRGDYFHGKALKRLLLTRVDPEIDYTW